MPNLASRNQSGHWYCCCNDSHEGWNGPSAVFAPLLSVAFAEAAVRRRVATNAAAQCMLTRAVFIIFFLSAIPRLPGVMLRSPCNKLPLPFCARVFCQPFPRFLLTILALKSVIAPGAADKAAGPGTIYLVSTRAAIVRLHGRIIPQSGHKRAAIAVAAVQMAQGVRGRVEVFRLWRQAMGRPENKGLASDTKNVAAGGMETAKSNRRPPSPVDSRATDRMIEVNRDFILSAKAPLL